MGVWAMEEFGKVVVEIGGLHRQITDKKIH